VLWQARRDALPQAGALDTSPQHDATTLIDNLIADVQSLELTKGTENSLLAKLNAAKRSLEKGNTTAAKRQLTAFIKQVSALSGGKIEEADADDLIAQAQAIIDCLP
jgi:hypothetical protein